MIYLLDTNTCIQYLTGRSENVINKFKTTHCENIYLCLSKQNYTMELIVV
jgi:tRNA(fMet)-specific endonuclease VapC